MSVYRTWSSGLSFALKQEVHSSHELFVLAKWTNQVLFGLVYHVSENKIHSNILLCPIDDFQESQNM